jgi:hypothetical protein
MDELENRAREWAETNYPYLYFSSVGNTKISVAEIYIAGAQAEREAILKIAEEVIDPWSDEQRKFLMKLKQRLEGK